MISITKQLSSEAQKIAAKSLVLLQYDKARDSHHISLAVSKYDEKKVGDLIGRYIKKYPEVGFDITRLPLHKCVIKKHQTLTIFTRS